MRRRSTLLLLLSALVALGSGASGARADSGDLAYDEGLQWSLQLIGAETAWETARGAGITIAVVDSGVALDHEDLAGKLVSGVACQDTGGDPAACSGPPVDDDGHGTHVAGIAGAATGNGIGIAGVAPDVSIMPIKVLFRACPGCQSSGRAEDVSAAVRWAAEQGADIINLSLGSTTSAVFGPGFAAAVDFAFSKGAIPVVAAGNDYVLAADLGDASAVVVSATDRDDASPPYSNGVGTARWAIAAPGGDGSDTESSCAQGGEPRGVLSTYWVDDDTDSAYACLSGTSMAAPHVSGALAVLRSAGYGPAEAVERLLATAVDLGAPGTDPVFGSGRLDLGAAAAAPPAVLIPPTAPTTSAADVTPATPPGTVPTDPPTSTPAPDGTETSAPLIFLDEPADAVPLPLVLLAGASVLAAAAATEATRRRLSRSAPGA